MEAKLYKRAVELAEKNRDLNTSTIQARLEIGYNRAIRIRDRLVDEGLVNDDDPNLTETGDYRRNWTLYVLKLEDEKYYVGITTKTAEQRMQDHIDKRNSAYWTAMHEPREVIYKKDLGKISVRKARKVENRLTRDLMKQRGINNVRGGDLTTTEELVKRFGWFLSKGDWVTVKYGLAMMVLSLLLGVYIASLHT